MVVIDLPNTCIQNYIYYDTLYICTPFIYVYSSPENLQYRKKGVNYSGHVEYFFTFLLKKVDQICRISCPVYKLSDVERTAESVAY